MNYIFFLLLICSSAYSWSPEKISQWDKISEKHSVSINSPSFATFWGGFRRGVSFSSNQGKMIDIKLEGFRKDIPVYFNVKSQKKDLIIFYPGVFGKPDGRISPQVINDLEKYDVHVIVIPNLLAPTYLSARPSTSGDPLKSEHSNQNKILSEVYKRLDKNNLGKVHVIAESLGCFQALMALEPGLPNLSSLTLLWPPLHLNRAIRRFDELISVSLPQLKKCSLLWKWPKIIYSTKAQTLPFEIDDDEKKCLGSWVIGEGFVGAIKETALEVTKVSDELVPTTFAAFVNSVVPEMRPIIIKDDERTSIEFLLRPFKDSQTKIRIASSIDDFLNVPEEWEQLKKDRIDLAPNIYLFSWGGHSGPVGMDDFIGSVAKQVLSN